MRLRRVLLVAFLFAPPRLAGADAWIAARADLSSKTSPALAAFPQVGGLLQLCKIHGRLDRIEFAVGGGKLTLRAQGRLSPADVGCIVGTAPDEHGSLAKGGPRIVAERGGVVLFTPGGEAVVRGRLAARLAAGKRSPVAIAFALEGADGLLTLDRRGGTLHVHLGTRTGLAPAVQAIRNAGGRGMKVDARGTDITVRSSSPEGLVRVARAAFLDLVPVSGGSMRPTLGVGEVALILKKPIAGPARPGDVVFYNDPDAPVTQVKRVLALAGERIQVEGHRLVVNGEKVEAFARNQAFVYEDGEGQTTGQLWREKLGDTEWNTLLAPTPADAPRVDLVVPKGTLYVLGDNRDASRDSRHTGPAAFAAVLGRAVMIAWAPLSRWQRIGQTIR
ncbi:MAG TPA: signal peptidase I [Haliangiales bacterium]|nr:signal peptidase I [Haliangiales bacterium]